MSFARLLNMPSIEGIVAVRTNASTAHAMRCRARDRHRRLPTYIVALGTDLVPVDIGIRHQVDIWMTYHPGCAQRPPGIVFYRLAEDAVRSQALSVVRRRIHSSARPDRATAPPDEVTATCSQAAAAQRPLRAAER